MFRNIYLEITNYCNLNCSFCPKTKRAILEMSLFNFENALKKLINYTDYFYLHVMGEPLTHSSLDEILSICDNCSAKIKITTNGSLLCDNLEVLKKHKSVKAINISLTCLSNFNDNLKAEYLDSVIIASKNLCEHGKAITLRYWLGEDDNFLLIKNAINEKLNYNITSSKGAQKIIDNLIFNKQEEFVWPVNSTQVENEKAYCLGLKKQIAVLSNGDVVPCCLDSEGQMKLGNIFKSSLPEILASPLACQIAEGFKNGESIGKLCLKCSFKNRFVK